MKISDARQLIQVKAPVLSRRRRVLANAFNVEEYRKSAQRVLPAGIFDYLDGGSEDEVTLRRNRAVFDSWALMPSWGPVSGPDTSTTLLGRSSALPLTLTPTGATRLFHPEGELAVAAAADRAHIPYGLAGLSTVAMETIAESQPGLDRWFNFGLTSDAQAMKDKLARCDAAGFNTLIVGVDTRALGARERDLHNGFTAPPALTLSTIADIARRPSWWMNFLKSDGISFPNLDPRSAAATSVVTPSMWQHILGHSDATSGCSVRWMCCRNPGSGWAIRWRSMWTRESAGAATSSRRWRWAPMPARSAELTCTAWWRRARPVSGASLRSSRTSSGVR